MDNQQSPGETRTVAYYLAQKYPIELRELEDEEGGGWLAEIPCLGRSTFTAVGDSPIEALETLERLKGLLFPHMVEEGVILPDPPTRDPRDPLQIMSLGQTPLDEEPTPDMEFDSEHMVQREILHLAKGLRIAGIFTKKAYIVGTSPDLPEEECFLVIMLHGESAREANLACGERVGIRIIPNREPSEHSVTLTGFESEEQVKVWLRWLAEQNHNPTLDTTKLGFRDEEGKWLVNMRPSEEHRD